VPSSVSSCSCSCKQVRWPLVDSPVRAFIFGRKPKVPTWFSRPSPIPFGWVQVTVPASSPGPSFSLLTLFLAAGQIWFRFAREPSRSPGHPVVQPPCLGIASLQCSAVRVPARAPGFPVLVLLPALRCSSPVLVRAPKRLLFPLTRPGSCSFSLLGQVVLRSRICSWFSRSLFPAGVTKGAARLHVCPWHYSSMWDSRLKFF
jgi:hypothetical protein